MSNRGPNQYAHLRDLGAATPEARTQTAREQWEADRAAYAQFLEAKFAEGRIDAHEMGYRLGHFDTGYLVHADVNWKKEWAELNNRQEKTNGQQTHRTLGNEQGHSRVPTRPGFASEHSAEQDNSAAAKIARFKAQHTAALDRTFEEKKKRANDDRQRQDDEQSKAPRDPDGVPRPHEASPPLKKEVEIQAGAATREVTKTVAERLARFKAQHNMKSAAREITGRNGPSGQ